MKKISFVGLCLTVMFLMVVFANNRNILGEEDMGWGLSFIAVLCAAFAAAVSNKWVAAINLFIGFALAAALGLISFIIYIIGLILIVWMVTSFPEVRKMITGLWEPERNENNEEEK